ncbi:Ig-like domain-containing protein [Chitinimonas naiadis]
MRRPLPLLLLTLLAPFSALADTATPQPEGALQYTGSTGRISIGYVDGGHVQGELQGVLSETADSAWLGEGWISRSAGGLQLSYHQAIDDYVAKYFLALDQNESRDRKLSIGYGLEQADWFGNAYLSHGLTARRQVGQGIDTQVSLVNGTDAGRPYVDTLTTTTTTRLFERAYDYGVGVRLGRNFDNNALRLTGGLDYEWGKHSARQTNLSLMGEKFFVGTPHSIALQLDHYQKAGSVDTKRSDNRAVLSYRYSFGKATSAQPERLFRMVEDARTPAEPTIIPAHTERKLVKTTASMNGDAFFLIGSAKLTDAARSELDKVVATLKTGGHEGNVRIVGHTCDLGSDIVNNKLSLERAEVVRDYLIQAGVLSIDTAVVEGKGKTAPKFPAKAATRDKNRRVDLEFVSSVEKEELVEVPAQTIPGATAPITYHREDIAQEPAWLRRALRNPAVHKRTVDVYRTEEKTQTQTSQREWVNRAPVAQSDSYSVAAGSSTALPVLANDRDPDGGDTLKLVSVTAAARGQVQIEGDQLRYIAPANFNGQDTFSYTVQDSHGLSTQASVVVNVAAPNHTPTAEDDVYVVSGFVPTTLPVLTNDVDPDSDPLTIVSVTQPNNGTVKVVGSQILFTPSQPFALDGFSYTINDGRGGESKAYVRLIDPINP